MGQTAVPPRHGRRADLSEPGAEAFPRASLRNAEAIVATQSVAQGLPADDEELFMPKEKILFRSIDVPGQEGIFGETAEEMG